MDGLWCAYHVMILINNQLLEGSTVGLTYFLGILIVDDVVCLTVDEQSWHCTLAYVLECDVKRVVLEFAAVFLGHLQGKRDHKLRRLDVFICNLERDHLEGVERRVDYLQEHVFGSVLEAVEES